MCVVSMVHDHYRPLIPAIPLQPLPHWRMPEKPDQEKFVILSPEEAERLRKLFADFKKAVEAAATVDALTGQPDCVDPEKKQLQDRIHELEAQLQRIEHSQLPR